MREEVDRMLAEPSPGASRSWTVNDAFAEYVEPAALHAYRRWDADADEDERAALEALSAQDNQSSAVGTTGYYDWTDGSAAEPERSPCHERHRPA
jgi:hypothetical protein